MLASHLLCESDKVQLFSFSMRTLVRRIYMYIYKYILKLYKKKKKKKYFSKCCLTSKKKKMLKHLIGIDAEVIYSLR